MRALTAAHLQVAAGLVAHALAAGCLPSGRSLALALPVAVLAVLAVGAVLRAQPLRSLAAGQLTVHACLSAPACAVGAAASSHAAHGPSHLLMTGAHVAALVLCRASADAVLRRTDSAVTSLVRLLRPAVEVPRLRLPAAVAPVSVPHPALRPRPGRHVRPPRRGPPAPPSRLLPA